MTKERKAKHAARMEQLKNCKLISAAHAKWDAPPSLAPKHPHPTALKEAHKQSVKKLNAKNFFVELVQSLAPGKDLTPTQCSQYKRVLAFLDA